MRVGHSACVIAFVSSACTSQAAIVEPGGVLTADLEMTVAGLFDGAAFPAVLNPDASHPDKVMVTNESGLLTGHEALPTTFSYVGMPLYAVVDATGTPWDYLEPLYDDDGMGNEDRSSPRFSLELIATLDMTLERPEPRTLVPYTIRDATLDVPGIGLFPLAGSFEINVPASGPPNFWWYGVGSIAFEGGPVSAVDNDASWTTGWPGTTLDKNFFPFVPAPGAGVLLALAVGAPATRRRARPLS